MDEIWFWQRIVSPHMAGLASALARQGCKVSYVAEQEMSADRAELGWTVPDMHRVWLRFVSDCEAVSNLVQEASARSVHFCQGIRSNGKVSTAQRALARRGLRQWIVMEAVDDAGAMGMLKRWVYDQRFRKMSHALSGVLATGHKTTAWVTARGMPSERVYPFAYFLPDVSLPYPNRERTVGPFRFLFVGQFTERKRLDLLVSSLQRLLEREFELLVVGAGPQERQLRMLAESTLPGRIRWLGKRSQAEVPGIMAQADCLILPSRHDGWGAVISESLMVGTPVICSDACGAAGVVQASGIGGVFSNVQDNELCTRLDEQLRSGPIGTDDRIRLSSWACALGAESGARYLLSILDCANNGGSRPMPPWRCGKI